MGLWKSVLATAGFVLISGSASAGEIWEFDDLKSIEYRESGTVLTSILIGTLINGTPVPWQPMPRESARCTELYKTMQAHPGVYVLRLDVEWNLSDPYYSHVAGCRLHRKPYTP
jgi:hypothetical protein